MKTMTHEMSDAVAKRVEDAFADTYPELVLNPDFDQTQQLSEENPKQILNTQPKWDHACERVTDLILRKLLSHEGGKAQNEAYQIKAEEIKKLVITTH